MSHRAESCSSSRATRRQANRASSHSVPYPVGTETGLLLIICPDCHLVRVIELRVKADTANRGRSFFKCPRNGDPKLCGFYRFQKEYFDVLVRKKIIRVSCEEIEEVHEESEDSGTGSPETVKEKEAPKDLELKLEKMMWKINFVMICVAVFVVGVVVKYIMS